MGKFFNRNWAGFLIDPATGADLVEQAGRIFPVDQPERVYAVEDGIIALISEEAAQAAAADDQKYAGWEAPDEFTFRRLPREGLPGWTPSNHWQKRALSTATMWHFLEEIRRTKGRPPIGYQGIAADLTDGLPYVGYGLDVGGFVTVVVSPNRGKYGLGAYPFSRYCRVQAEWGALPLKPWLFDVVVCSGAIPQVPAEILPGFLKQVARALNEQGYLLITDAPDTEAITSILKDLHLKVQTRPVRDDEPGLGNQWRRLLGRTIDVPPLIIAGTL